MVLYGESLLIIVCGWRFWCLFPVSADEGIKAYFPQLTEEEDYNDKECIDELIDDLSFTG